MRAGDLAPDHSDLGAANALRSLVDERNLLAEVEAVQSSDTAVVRGRAGGDLLGSLGVIDTLDLDEAGLRVDGVAATLVGEVATPESSISVSLVYSSVAICAPVFVHRLVCIRPPCPGVVASDALS